MASKLKLTELLYPTSTTPAITINADDTVTFGAPTTTITNLSTTSITDSGNLTFTGTGNRILGDFSNATIASRVAFQTSTTNGQTRLTLIPNGTGTDTAVDLFNNSSDLVNVGRLSLRAGLVDMAILSTREGTGTYLPMTFYTGGSEAMRITTDRNVGIGTSSPGAKLEVRGNIQARVTNDILDMGITSSVAYLQSYNTTGLAAIPLAFYTGTAERARIDTSGNLLVGGTTGGVRLYVKGAGATSSTYSLYVQNSTPTDLFYIRNDGAINSGVAAVSPYNNTTGVAANMVVGSDGFLYRSTSSLKYKTDVQDTAHGLAELLTLRPVTYKGKNDGDKVFGGLIAEEVHEAGLTEFVQYAKDGSPDALAYGNMVSLCIKAIQEQQALITDLTTRLNTLEGN